MKDYKKQYLDPRWQRKRLFILERDDWRCQCCYSKENTLNVHHRIYINDKDLWDYPDNLLITLCVDCHKSEKEDMQKSLSELNLQMKKKFLSDEVMDIAIGIKEIGLDNFSELTSITASAIRWSFSNKKMNEIMMDTYKEFLINKRGENGKTDKTRC